MNSFFWRKIIPRIAGILAIIIVRYVPALEGAEEAVTSALLAIWGVVEIILAKNHADRQELVAGQQRVLKAEGLYAGKIDGQAGPKFDAAVRSAVSLAQRVSEVVTDAPPRTGGHPAK